ncbi:MAG: FAD-binding oxidoreductase [Halorientalis sp.]
MDASECEIVAVESVGPDAVAIALGSPPGFDAQPGQFVKVVVDLRDYLDDATVRALAEDDPDLAPAPGEPVEVARFYTISSPDVADTFELTVSIDPDGTLGPALREFEPGDELVVSGPFGSDYYEGEGRSLIVAGGPGVGPAVGIAERALADGTEAAVVYRDDDPLHADRLAAVRDAGAHVTVLAGDEPLDAAVAEAFDALGGHAQVFVYGFADFIDAATGAIEAAGAEAGEAKIENFG